MEFRNLYKDEIQIRPTDTKYKGSCTLLLYQDARAAMDILDEKLGCEKWSKDYYEVAGQVYCRIGILCESGWVWKGDTGAESNIDREKGLASDAFKRAAVNWGIGRELYTAPRIKIKCPDNYYYNDNLCMTFYVRDIRYEGKRITELVISDKFDNIVFNWSVNDGVRTLANPNNEKIFTEYCTKLKKEGNDRTLLMGFYNKYIGRMATWTGNLDPATLWKKHLSYNT